MGQLGHLVGIVGRYFAIVDGRASLWLACQPHQLTRHDGFYASSRPLDHGVTVACTHRLASRRLFSVDRCRVWCSQFGSFVFGKKMGAQISQHHAGGRSQCCRQLCDGLCRQWGRRHRRFASIAAQPRLAATAYFGGADVSGWPCCIDCIGQFFRGCVLCQNREPKRRHRVARESRLDGTRLGQNCVGFKR